MKRSEEKLYWNSMRFKPLEGIDEIMSHTSDLDTNHVVFHSRARPKSPGESLV